MVRYAAWLLNARAVAPAPRSAGAPRNSTVEIGEEIRRLRVDAGLSQGALAGAAGLDPSYLSLLERGLREPSLTALQSVATALGADLAVRFYPNTGPVIHDRRQSPILDALLACLGPMWRRAVEVPVHRPAWGVIDCVLHRPDVDLLIAAEIESSINRLEQQIRWGTEKAESLPSSAVWRFAAGDRPPEISRLLLIRSMRATRDLAVRYEHVIRAAFPATSRDAYDALVSGSPWPGPALLWADLSKGVATIRRVPPRGVSVG